MTTSTTHETETTTTQGVTMHRVDVPAVADEHAEAMTFLATEFPAWDFAVAETLDGRGDLRPLFVASQDGHHPQSELTPAKLHTRLSDYLGRESRRQALMN